MRIRTRTPNNDFRERFSRLFSLHPSLSASAARLKRKVKIVKDWKICAKIITIVSHDIPWQSVSHTVLKPCYYRLVFQPTNKLAQSVYTSKVLILNFFLVPGFDESERIAKPEHFYAVFFWRKKIAKITWSQWSEYYSERVFYIVNSHPLWKKEHKQSVIFFLHTPSWLVWCHIYG